MHRTSRLIALAAVATLAPTASAQASGGVIVDPRPGVSAAALTDLLGSAVQTGRIYGTDTRVVRAADPAGLVARLNRSGLVRFAERDRTLRATAVPNDPRFASLYGLDKVDAPEAWDALALGGFPATGGAKIGIVDTGIRRTHEDLGSARVVDCANAPAGGLLGGLFGGGGSGIQEGTCADGNGHGTHVAGTIAGTANNAKGVAGVSFDSPLSICKALTDAGSGSTSGVASCIRYLKDKNARIISMSLGGGASTALQQAVQYAWAGGNGALLVAAAGNDGNGTLNYPAAYAEVVSVAATDQNDAKASFSNVNGDVEIAAPGVGITSTWSTSDTAYNTISGTSMATPHVAGVAGLLAKRTPGATAQGLRTALTAPTAVDDLGAPGRDTSFGVGRTNARKAVG